MSDKKIKNLEISMKEGERLNRNPNKPVIHINEKGPQTYLWVGNNGEEDGFCFATLSGMKTLEKLAFGILKALGHKPNWLAPDKPKNRRRK